MLIEKIFKSLMFKFFTLVLMWLIVGLNSSVSQNLDEQLLEAVKQNDGEAVAELLLNEASPNSRDENGASVLMWAVYKADIAVVKELISLGANPQTKGVIYVDSTLQSYYGNLVGIAAGEGQLEKLQYLIEQLEIPVSDRELNPQTKKEDGWTGVQWAWNKEHPELFSYLSERGADVLSDQKRQVQEAKNEFGAQSNQYMNSVYGLAELYDYLLNDYSHALIYYQTAFRIAESMGDGGGGNPRVILNRLANIHSKIEDYPKADSLYTLLLEFTQKERGTNNPDYIFVLKKLTDVKLMKGEYDKAKPLLDKEIEIQKLLLGENSKEYAEVVKSIAYIFSQIGEFEEAVSFYSEVADIMSIEYGKNHIEYSSALGKIARLYLDAGDYKQSEEYYLKSLKILRSNEEYKTYVSVAIGSLGNVYKGMGELEKAENCLKESLSGTKNNYGVTSNQYSVALGNLGQLYIDIGKFEEAEGMLLEALSIVEENLGKSDESYATSLNNIGVLYSTWGKYQKSLEYHLQALDANEEIWGRKHPNYIMSLSNIGSTYRKLGDYSNAESIHLEALEVTRNHFGSEHPRYVQTLSNLAEVYREMGLFEEAIPLYEEALEIGKRAKTELQPNYLATINNYGLCLSDMGNYEKAEAIFLENKKNIGTKLGESHPYLVLALGNLGQLYLIQGDFSKSELVMKKAIAIGKESMGEAHPLMLSVYGNLALQYQEMGMYPEAEEILLKVVKIRQETVGDQHPDFALALNNLGLIYHKLGVYEKSEPLFNQAREVIKSSLGINHPSYATTLNNLAQVHTALFEYEEARELFLEAVFIHEETIGKFHPQYATSLNNLALNSLEMGDYFLGDSLLTEALEIWKVLFGEQNSNYALALQNLGWCKRQQSKLIESELIFRRATAINEAVLGVEHEQSMICLENLSDMYRAQNKFDLADSCYSMLQERTIRRIKDGFDYLSDSEKKSNVNAYTDRLNRIRSFQNDNFSKHPELAKQNYNLEILTKGIVLRSGMKMQNLLESSGDTATRKPYERLAAIKTILSKQIDGPKKKGRVFTGVGVAFSVVDDTIQVTPITGGPAESAGILKGDKIISVNGKAAVDIEPSAVLKLLGGRKGSSVSLQVLSQGSKTPRVIDVIRDVVDTRSSYQKMSDEAEELEKQLARISSAFSKGRQLNEITWADVRTSLEDDEVTIEFSSFPYYRPNGEWSDSTFYIALVLRKGFEHPIMVSLCEVKQLDSLFQRKDSDKELIADLYRGAVPVGENGLSYGMRLYQLLWEPLDSLLKEGDQVHFAPSALLHKIALSAIPYGDTEQLLSDRYQLNRLSTTANLVTDRDKKDKRPKEIVLFGGIDYDFKPTAKATKKDEDVYVSKALPIDFDRGNTSWSYLPGTLKETESIATIAGRENINFRTYIGADATEAQIKALGGKNSPTVLHIASHGFFFPDPERDLEQDRMMQLMSDREQVYRYSDDPLNRAGLLFAGASHTWNGEEVPEGMEDGILTANEATYIPLINTELVVLSACETGLGEVKGSEGVFGLQRAFKAAGAEYVMMSLWKVPDQETSEFMESFYGHYLSDYTIPDSYHYAQRTMREKYPNDPYKWAGFVLMK
jgi:tetratricopeptide (TPR) repeat protein/CHAT domain-containing protein